MFKRIEEHYSSAVLMPNLEEKKRTLATIRSLHSPLNTESLQEYGKKIQDIVDDKIEKKREERMKLYDEHRKNYNYKEFET